MVFKFVIVTVPFGSNIKVMMKICGYGSLAVAKIVILLVNVNLFGDTTVRLKGIGAPCLQSCF